MLIYSYLLLLFAGIGPTKTPINSERLLVFYQVDKDLFFAQKTLSALSTFAEEEGLELVVNHQLTAGLPEKITTTPALIFQHARGESTYAGRYTELNTIRNFVRIARLSQQSDVLLEKTDLWVKKAGRAQIALALKVTPLQGDIPAGFAERQLVDQIKAGITQGLSNYEWTVKAALERTDRLFYLDIHPYINETGQLYLSTAIFSQFSCIDPIEEQFDQPLSGPLIEVERLGQLIGQSTAGLVQKTLAASEIGDAYTPVPSLVAFRSLTELGFPQPVAEVGRVDNRPLPEYSLPRKWKLSGPISPKVPLIQFHFLAPLERYAGEVRKAKGQLELDANGVVEKGAFTVDVKSLTMGMESFDTKVLKSYVKVNRYPESSFLFKEVRLAEPLAWGRTGLATVSGDFKMLGKTRTIQMNAILVPTIDNTGQPMMLVQADFELNITDLFGIKGPDGPDPAKKTLAFNLSLLLRAVDVKAENF